MANHYLLNQNTSKMLEQVLDDKKREFADLSIVPLDEGGEFIYTFALDAHEIGKYCFPVDIYKTYRRNELEEIVDSQIAYFDVFSKHNTRPIIFEEYERELEATFDYFLSYSDEVKRESIGLLQEAFFSNIRNISNQFDENTDSNDFIIAFNLALMTFGTDRLIQVYPRVQFESKNKENFLFNELNTYEINESRIRKLVIDVKKRISILNESSLRRDIISIDKVYFLNKIFINNNIPHRVIYFSSAQRTKYIIEALEDFKSDTSSNFCNFDPWRTPIQIYLYLILRELNEKKQIITNKTIERLETFKSLFDELETVVESYPEKEQVTKQFNKLLGKQRNNYIQSLDNAETSQLGKIVTLYQITSGENQRNIDNNINKYFRNEKDEVYEFLSRIATSEIDIDILVEQIQTNLKLSEVIPLENAENDDDIITNCYDAFPFLLFIENETYKDLLNDLFEYWFDYYEKTQHHNLKDFDKNKILKILEDFISINIDTTERHPNYYVLSTMLHLINSNRDSDESSKRYIEKLEKFSKVHNDTNLLYIKASILRRNHEYKECIDFCKTYKERDFRFGYCSALALVGLNLEGKIKIPQHLEEIDVAINDLIYAFHEIDVGLFTHKDEFKAAISSNIVFLASLYFHHSKEKITPKNSKYIKISGEYKRKLKELKPKEEWEYLFPDYYHTEAFSEYVTTESYLKYKQGISDINIMSESSDFFPSESWEDRLSNAINDINKAIKYCTVRRKVLIYRELKVNLKNLANKL